MKTSTVQINFSATKLKAIQKYMQKKEASLQGELDDALQRLYEKYVPREVREYIEDDGDEKQAASKKGERLPRPEQGNKPASHAENE